MANRGLGTLTLALAVKLGAFEQGLDKAARHTDKRMRDMERRANAFGRAFGNSLKLAGGVAAAGLGLYIKNTIEAEKVQAQLAARIKDTFGAAGRSIKQLNAEADKLQSLTVFDDEAIGSVQAMLLTFKQIQGVNFDDATAAVLDLSTAMGTDAQSAAVQLGKALNDPVRGISALAKAGVQFSEDQRKVIKTLVETGDVAGAQRVILKELESQMGSAAEAARNTLGGALTGLKNSFNNLLEGDAGGGGLKAAREAVEGLISTMNDPDVKAGVDSIVSGMLNIANAAIRVIAKVGEASSALQEFFDQNENKGNASLTNRKNELETELFKAQRRSGQGLSDANDPIGKMLGMASGRDEKIKALKAEIAEIEALQKARAKASMFDGVVGNYQNNIGAGKSSAGGGSSKGGSGKSKAAREMPDFAKEAADELSKLVQVELQAREGFEAMAASLSGPVAEANYNFARQMEELNQLARDGAIATPELTAAQDNLRSAHEKNVETIQAQLEPQRAVLEAIREETMLLGLSAEQQEVYNNLKAAGVEANSAFGQSIIASTENLQAMREQTAFVDEFKEGLGDVFAGFIEGSEKGKAAFKSFADDLYQQALRILANKAITALLNSFSMGGSGAGAAAAGSAAEMSTFQNWFNSFGGGRASGGSVAAGMFYKVNEQGPEMLTVGGSDYLMMGRQAGHVTANPGMSGGGVTQTVNFQMAAPTDPRTQAQIAAKINFHTQRAVARNR